MTFYTGYDQIKTSYQKMLFTWLDKIEIASCNLLL